MSYRICSFNVLRSIRSDTNDRAFYALLYQLIADEGIDIFAFQEAKNINFIKNVVKNVVKNLLSHWVGEPVQDSELAFVWNANRVAECSKHREPHAVNYRSKRPMSREPILARFVPVDFKLNFEMRLVNVHIKHGGDDSAKSIDTRKYECSLAKGIIYEMVDKPPTGKDGSFRSVFTVVLGDYNLDCDACNQCGPEIVRTFQDEKTTLKASELEPGYKNSYDHFSYRVDSTEPRSTPYRIDAVRRYFNGDFKGYRKKVSDHVPVKLELL